MARRSGSSGPSKKPGPAQREKSKAVVDRDRLLDFFLNNPDRVLSNKELQKVLGDERSDSWTRRLRELRKPEFGGYIIRSVRDRVGLKSDEYLFPRQERREPLASQAISGRLRGEVFDRDAYTCQSCGLARGQRHDDGRSVTLHIGHNRAQSHGGKPTADNLLTLCSQCNEAESNVGPDRPTVPKTMAQVRRLPKHEQREIFDFLKSVFDR